VWKVGEMASPVQKRFYMARYVVVRSRQLSWNKECGLNLKLFTVPFLQTNMIMLFMPRHAQHVNSQMCLHWSSAHLRAVTSAKRFAQESPGAKQ